MTVGLQLADAAVDVAEQPDRARVGSRLDRRRDGIEQARHRDRLDVELEVSGRDAADVEQLLDQPGLRLRTALDHGNRLRELGVGVLAPRQQMGPAEDRAERRAQLVGQRRQEFVLHPARPLGHGPRIALCLEQELALRLELLLPADVERHAIEADRRAELVAVDQSLRAQPAPLADRRHRAVLDVVGRPLVDRSRDRRARPFAVLLVDAGEEHVEVDLGAGRKPEVVLAGRIPDNRPERERAVEGAQLGGIERKLERVVRAQRLGPREPLRLAGNVLLDQVAARLVLARARAQRRARAAHHRLRIERALEQDHVAEPPQQIGRRGRPAAGAPRRQHDERKVGPRRLAGNPRGERLGRLVDKRLLGHEGEAGAVLQLADQLGHRTAGADVHRVRAQHVGYDDRVTAARRQHEDPAVLFVLHHAVHSGRSAIITVLPA